MDDGPCPEGRTLRACLLNSVTIAGPNRLLHIEVDVRRSDDELIALVGHELQHAVEILSDPTLRNHAAVLMFYQRVGIFRGGTAAETTAALQTQATISAEIKAPRGWG